jgi:hypothetical protein
MQVVTAKFVNHETGVEPPNTREIGVKAVRRSWGDG